jgi:hypothetical protein
MFLVPNKRANPLRHISCMVQPLLALKFCHGIFKAVVTACSFILSLL